MKKRVIKKKKTIKVYRGCKGIRRAFSLAAAICLLTGMALTVQGEEAGEADTDAQVPKVVITEIYHKHLGDAGKMGGCYNVPVMHQHQGNEEDGGPCYQTPVFHTHQGSETEGGGCYTQPVYHEHQGDEQQGGACYEEITHVHTPECYQQEVCVLNHTLAGEVIETWTGHCFIHQDTTFGKALGITSHGSCGEADEENYFGYCLACGFIAPTVHSYQVLTCETEEGTVTGYQLSCGKDENTIDGYLTGCGFKESETEAYALSCDKTVDGYLPDCGLKEGQLCGRMIVTNETGEQAEHAVISARLEDLTGGKLKTAVPAFEWKDADGQRIGTGESIIVNENGSYSVFLRLENRDVDEAGLHSSIIVDNIFKVQQDPAPVPTAEATQTPGEEAQPSGPSGETNETNEEDTVALVPKTEIASENTDNIKDDGQGISDVGERKQSSAQAETSVSPSPTKMPVRKERQTVKLKESDAQKEISYQIGQEEKQADFFDRPEVKILAVTGSAFLVIAGLFLLLFYLRCSVKILNDDGEGRMIRLGRCMVKLEEESYAVTITEAMVEKACTNRYCIKPGLFLLGKKEGQELIVYQGTKGVTAYLSKEIIVMI